MLIVKLLGAAGIVSGTIFVVVFIIIVAGIMYLRRQRPKPTSPRFSPPTVDIYEAKDVSDGNVDHSADDGDVESVLATICSTNLQLYEKEYLDKNKPTSNTGPST